MLIDCAHVGVDVWGCHADRDVASSGIGLRFVGPPAVRVCRGRLTHQQQALIAFVALCGPSSGDDITLALWQGRVMSTSRLPNLLAEVRGVIGREHLPPAEDGYYRLQGVCSDVDRLDALCESSQYGVEWMERAREALAGIGGLPLHRSAGAGRAYWTWLESCFVRRAHVERQTSQLALTVSDVVAADDPWLAVWALEQGLRAVPDDERLHQQLASLYRAMGYASSARTVSASLR